MKFFLFVFILISMLFAFYNMDMFKIIVSIINSPIGVVLISFIASVILFFKKNRGNIIIVFLFIIILFFLIDIFLLRVRQ